MTQADRIIRLFGGPTRLQRLLGLKYASQVTNWRRYGGAVPPKHWQGLLAAATQEDIPLTLEHLMGTAPWPADPACAATGPGDAAQAA